VYEKSDKETFYIGLPDNFINTRVKIEYEVLEDNAFANFNSLIVIDQNSYAKEVIGQNMEKLLISSIVFLYGSMVVLYCIYKWKKRLFIIRGILIGLFLMCLGGWIFSNNESYSILLGSNEHRIILKYYTIYFGSPILLLCLQNTLKSKNNKRIMLGLFFIQLAMAVVFTSINIVDNSYRSKFLLAIEVMAIFSIIVGRSMVCLDYSFFTNAEKKIISAFVIIGLSLVIEVIRYLLVYFNGYQYEIGNVFLMGVIMFGAGLVRAYMDYGYEIVKKDFFINKRYDKFNKDILTGLYDRQHFIDEMKEYNNKKNYTLLCFDLNGLKNVNLLYGYSNGDRYIELFAKKLKHYFSDDFISISRISGDEFAMVSEVYMPKYIIKKKMKKMSVDLKKECKRELDVNVSFSYGYCVSKRRKIVKIKDAFTIANKMIMDNKRIKTAE